ncbi:hypothetical protein, partial [Winogradskyella ouciana]|uniref:hypothetical protein n=1 Tax=Winogradskyella ouciana TaxID=2608631 RepID=UPI001F180231
ISLRYRLLNGSLPFKELNRFVEDGKTKLEAEVGSLSRISATMVDGIVSTLSVSADVANLCSLAIEKANELLGSTSQSDPNHSEHNVKCP